MLHAELGESLDLGIERGADKDVLSSKLLA
jgi:hypothetical protein